MKKVLLSCSAIAVLGLVSCSPSKEKLKSDFVKACDAGDKQMPNEQMKKIFHEYCDCSGDKVVDKFTVKELEEINKMQTTAPDPAKQQEVQAKLMTAIQPCLTDMQNKTTNAMGGSNGMSATPGSH